VPNHEAARATLDEVIRDVTPGTTIVDIDATDPEVASTRQLQSPLGGQTTPPPRVLAPFGPQSQEQLPDGDIHAEGSHEDETVGARDIAKVQHRGDDPDEQARSGFQQLGRNATSTDSAIRGPHAPTRARATTRAATCQEAPDTPDRHREK
jgi:hypothetical protein